MRGYEFIQAIEKAKTAAEIERLCRTLEAETEMMIRRTEKARTADEIEQLCREYGVA